MSKSTSAPQSIYTIPVRSIDGQNTSLEPYRGKVMLIVNVASRCGFTKQYAQLETLYQRYKAEGFVVLGFPCNQFFNQEPGSNSEINHFATSCFHVTFPMFEKISVKGPQQSPLYAYIETHLQKKPWFFIPWNFTKFLVNREGVVLEQLNPMTSVETLTTKIEHLLREQPQLSP